jgi:Flp pilus assembly protein TadG
MTTKDLHNFTGAQRPSQRAQSRHRGELGRVAALRTRVADQRGQALAEFVLVLPILLAVMFGIVEFGLALNTESDETHLANEVARYAIVNQNPGGAEELQQWAVKQGDNNFVTGTGKICISFPEGQEEGKPVKVEATAAFKWLPILPSATTTLKGTAYMRLETAPSNFKAGCSK